MTQRINQLAVGLLDALESKSLGKAPSELADVVQPTLRMDDFYLGLKLTFRRSNNEQNLFGAGGLITSFTVPLGEAWYLKGVGCGFRTDGIGNATGISIVTLNFRNTGNSVEGALATFDTKPASPAGAIGAPGYTNMLWLPTPFLLLGGESIRFYAINPTVAVPGDFLYWPNAWYSRLEV